MSSVFGGTRGWLPVETTGLPQSFDESSTTASRFRSQALGFTNDRLEQPTKPEHHIQSVVHVDLQSLQDRSKMSRNPVQAWFASQIESVFIPLPDVRVIE